MQDIQLKDLLEAGCHFGHKAERWHPKAQAFIYLERDGIHVIDLAKTKSGLTKAAEFIKSIAQTGGKVLFVGTKRQAASIIKEEAIVAGAPYISHRWIGGFLTNWEQVHKNLEKIRRLTEEEKTGAWKIYPKHERVKLSRYLRRLEQFYGGVVELREPPKALMVVDIRREAVSIHEATKMGTPVVGVVDTNSDPTLVTYAVPANDDAVGSVKFIVHYLTQSYKEGREQFEKETAKKLTADSSELSAKNKTDKEDKKEMVNKQSTVDSKQQVKPENKKAEEAGKVEKVEKIKQVEKVEQVEKAEKVEEKVKTEKTEEKATEAPKKRGRKKKVAE